MQLAVSVDDAIVSFHSPGKAEPIVEGLDLEGMPPPAEGFNNPEHPVGFLFILIIECRIVSWMQLKNEQVRIYDNPVGLDASQRKEHPEVFPRGKRQDRPGPLLRLRQGFGLLWFIWSRLAPHSA